MLAASLPACREGHTCSCGYEKYEGRTQTGAGRRAACGMCAARVQGAEALLVDMIVTHASTQTNFSSLDDGLLVGLCCSNFSSLDDGLLVGLCCSNFRSSTWMVPVREGGHQCGRAAGTGDSIRVVQHCERLK